MNCFAVEPVFLECDPGRLCRLPYPGHPRGCPNYGKRDACPPRAEIWNRDSFPGHEWHAVWVAFDMAAHVSKMRKKHPAWSDRQCRNLLYWQGSLVKQLRSDVELFVKRHKAKHWHAYYIPEAHGVNVFATMASIGVHLEWNPSKTVHKVALVKVKSVIERSRK